MLGQFRVSVDGSERSQWSRQKPKLLVKLLALQAHHELHREQVMEMLWPESDPESAVNNLHKAIHLVRHALEPELKSAANSHFILTRGQQILLTAPGELAIDVEAFEQQAAEAIKANEVEAYEHALALYGGELLTEDLYEDWTATRREQLRGTQQELLMRLARLHEARSEYHQSIKRFKELTLGDPANEEVHRCLMQLYAVGGHRQQALRQYKQCCDALLKELDATPEPATQQLYEKILAGELQPTINTGQREEPVEKIISLLAILPLVNASADAGVDYFSDGITESLINNLSQLRQLRVMAHSTVFRYKGQDIDPQQVGGELKVHAVLTGRVLQRGDRLNIRVELVDVRDGARLWGEHYDRSLADIFAVQEEIAREIYENLRLKLTGEEQQRLIKRPTENTLAYHAYLKGRYCWNKRTNEWLEKGMVHFQQAIELDPNYAAAYAGLSDSYTLLVIHEVLPPGDGFSRAKATAAMALRIDESLAEAHASLAHAMLHNWEWTSAEQEFKKAIEINPAYPSAHHWYSEYWEATGYLDKAIAEAKTAQEHDPLSLIINAHLADLLYFARRYEESVKQAMKTLEFDQNFSSAHQNLSKAYTEIGMYEEALSELQTTLKLRGDSMECAWLMGHIYARSGKIKEAQDVIDQLIEQSKNRYVSPCGFAFIHAALGEKDQAFTWLEKAYEQHCAELFDLKVEPKYDSLRTDPRFRNLLQRIGLE
jgi:DNA-binding SARP family transcriptional activator/Tfp pilus assembly protein PilF